MGATGRWRFLRRSVSFCALVVRAVPPSRRKLAATAARTFNACRVMRFVAATTSSIDNSTPALEANLVGPFREGLRELGYVFGGGYPGFSSLRRKIYGKWGRGEPTKPT
jgi:hypothetical protein